MIGLKDFKFNDEDFNHEVENDSLSVFLYLQQLCLNKKVAFFLNKNSDIDELVYSIKSLNKNIVINEFPAFDCSFLSNLSPTIENKYKRVNSLYNINQKKNTILVGSIEAIIEKTVDKDFLRNKELSIKVGSKKTYNEILNYLNNNNYENVSYINNVGEYSKRGEIIDIFSPIENNPVRIFFDFDKVDKIKIFSLENQKTINECDEYKIYPPSEFFFTDENIQIFRQNFRKLKLTNKDEFYNSLSNNVILEGSDQFFPILNKNFMSILDYLEGYKIFFQHGYIETYKSLYEQKIDEYGVNSHFFKNDSSYLLNYPKFSEISQKNKITTLSHFNLTGYDNKFSIGVNFNKFENINEKFKFIINQKSKILIFTYDTEVNKLAIKRILDEFNKSFLIIDDLFTCELKATHIYLVKIRLNGSFEIKVKENIILFISHKDIFNKVVTQTKKITENVNLIKDFSQLHVGDLVVHIDHGIGRYNGLKKRNFGKIDNEFIEIIYQSDDKLFIPVQNLELISKYGESDNNVSLDKLGLSNWQKRKAIIKKKIKDIANDLVKVAAERKLRKGEVIEPNKFEYDRFSALFEFTETSDQLKTINQVETDLLSGKPMDRLICGDVGFGKTEIAMRAAFICLTAGYQVVMICPKVLLVNQHFLNFKKRFNDFNYKISKISRLESGKEKKIIKKDIENGSIDLLIATHAIFADDIRFLNLGLIIIDEEQSFGVEQKEKLKKFKPNCHILTLSATPIPRTLQSSIFKIKDISLIQTPPVNRLNIKTFLMLEDINQISRAISQELDRQGQVFYVSPRISDLDNIQKKLKKKLPKLNIGVIHGRLANSEVERVYENFYNKNIKVLLSTAMIESGLDLSNVNTIIIEKPNLFGLAQLYQLRGRVGRSSLQAYAYLIIENLNSLNDESLKKVKLISKIDKLGSGLSIASSDLSIRGAGNIIGSEQSGHIKEVGVELYYQMVQDTINEIKNESKQSEKWSPQINLGFSFNISNSYIKDSDERLSLYRQLSHINNVEKLEEIFDNLKDTYGNLPNNFKNLMYLMEIKIIAKELFIKKIDDTNYGFVIEFREDARMDINKLIKFAQINSKLIELKPKSKVILKSVSDKNEKINHLKEFLNYIQKNLLVS